MMYPTCGGENVDFDFVIAGHPFPRCGHQLPELATGATSPVGHSLRECVENLRADKSRLQTLAGSQQIQIDELRAENEQLQAKVTILQKSLAWHYCPTHQDIDPSAWGCPECVRELRVENERLRAERDDWHKAHDIVEEAQDRQSQTIAALRAENERLQAELNKFQTPYYLRLEERNQELSAENERLKDVERQALDQSEYIQTHGLTEYEMHLKDAKVDQLRAMLSELEWLPSDKMDPVLFPNLKYCPICRMPNHHGHSPWCRLAAALGA